MLSKSLISASLLAAAASALPLPDRDAPQIDGLAWTTEVTVGSSFKASLTATDPLGVKSISFGAYPNQGWWYPCPDSTQFTLVNGTAFEGTWEVECPIPAETPSQTYAFNYNCVDTEGHSTYETFKNGFGVSGGPNAEYDAPTIEKITCTETLAAGSALDVYLTIADASGVQTEMSYVKVHQSDGNVSPCASQQFVLESGSPTEGVFRASCVVPTDTPNGEYWLEVHVYDTQHNPAEQKVEDAFVVVGGATPDHTPPSIKDIKYADSKVERGETLSLTVSVSDLESGMDYVTFSAREYYTQTLLCQGPMALQSGDMVSGVWAFSCEVPADASIDYYTGSVNAYDNQNNQALMTASFNVVMPTSS